MFGNAHPFSEGGEQRDEAGCLFCLAFRWLQRSLLHTSCMVLVPTAFFGFLQFRTLNQQELRTLLLCEVVQILCSKKRSGAGDLGDFS
jgi:hypothetical protein